MWSPVGSALALTKRITLADQEDALHGAVAALLGSASTAVLRSPCGLELLGKSKPDARRRAFRDSVLPWD